MSDIYAEVIAQYNGDLVKEARVQSFCMTQNYSSDLIWRLADEIERLRAENKRIIEALDDPELSAVARILRARLGGPPVVTLTEGEAWPERKA